MWSWFIGRRCVVCAPAGSARHVVINAVTVAAVVMFVAEVAAVMTASPAVFCAVSVVCVAVAVAVAAVGVVCVRRSEHNR